MVLVVVVVVRVIGRVRGVSVRGTVSVKVVEVVVVLAGSGQRTVIRSPECLWRPESEYGRIR